MMERHYPNSKALCEAVLAASGPTVLLSFSSGKDGLAAWIQLRDQGFTNVIPFYMYSVPGIQFIEQGLNYYEQAFQTKILRVPHPRLPRMLRNLVFQPPERAAILEQIDFPKLTYEDIDDHVRKISGCPDAFVATGMRAADSPTRAVNIRRTGSLNPRRRSFAPVFDWKMDDVRGAILRNGLKLTCDYKLFGRSFDGLDWRFCEPISRYYPEDWERIKQWFPLVELELFRRTLGRSGRTKTQSPIDSGGG